MEYVGKSAFSDCTSLKSITLPNGVKSIGVNAFDGCEQLENINIPDSIMTIGNNAFRDCNNLTITISESAYTRLKDSLPQDVKISIIGRDTELLAQALASGIRPSGLQLDRGDKTQEADTNNTNQLSSNRSSLFANTEEKKELPGNDSSSSTKKHRKP